MIHFHAYLNVNGEYIDGVTSKAETIKKIDLLLKKLISNVYF